MGKSKVEGNRQMNITLAGLPDIAGEDKAILNTRITRAVNDMLTERYQLDKPEVKIASSNKEAGQKTSSNLKEDNDESEKLAVEVQMPQYTFDQIILDDSIMQELQYSIKFEQVRDKVYNDWGLSKIEPSPKLALNFHGASGTGKTMAAHTLASAMGRKIILASYAEIESKYHGDGPKNVKKLFQLAAETNAVLFIDEADSLLSKRLTNVTQGSEQAINSMRSQLLIQIEQFSGVVVFATNLASNYDSAFVTRIKSIHFTKPDQAMRRKMWDKMLLPSLPLDPLMDTEQLAAIEDVCGRDIKNAIVKAAIKTAVDGESVITQKTLEDAIRAIVEANRQITGKLSSAEKREIEQKIKQQQKKDRIRKRRHF
jgi:SpoVK/Ycf46/Vps4 family AAA+-type ATPase